MIYYDVLFVLLYPVMISAGGISSFNEYRGIPSTSCEMSSVVNNYYDYYIDSSPNVTFNNKDGWTVMTHEKCNPQQDATLCGTYSLQSVRKYTSPLDMCTYCPYHLDPYWYTDNANIDQTNKNDPSLPMYGPCLDNQPSLKMVCLQHHALFPQKFFGKYFYPPQVPIPNNLWQEYYNVEDNFNYPEHQFLSSGGSELPYTTTNDLKSPTTYGLGKDSVIANLNDIRFIYTGNGTLNEPMTNEFKKPFITDATRVEQWMKWAQYFCLPGCHRNDRHSLIRIRRVDIEGDPELAYLSLFVNDDVTKHHACRPCPPYTASYNWLDTGPAHPKTNIMADQCYPWFGAIPNMVPLGQSYVMNVSNFTRDINVDKIFLPDTDYYVHHTICPVNTYNRVCAHTKENIYNAAQDSSPPSVEKMKQYYCTQCPYGYHTNGNIGQWYCIPPIGMIFIQRDLLGSQFDLWGNRSLLNYELECGPRAEHCRQCSEYKLNTTTTPEQFNEKFVFTPLLADTWCSERFYCPDAFTSLACPIERPWSPQGSWHPSNCTCAKGKYWNSTDCVACTSICTIPGYYLPLSKCMQKNGAIKDAPCMWCDNIPDKRAVPDGVGFEFSSGIGSCPYHCIPGSEMYVVNSSLGKCEKSYACAVPRARVNAAGRYVYKEVISLDSIQSCIIQSLFSVQLSQINTNAWQVQPITCIGQCNASSICYAKNASSPLIDSTIPWYSMTAPLVCSMCPSLNELPQRAYLKVDTVNDLISGINYCVDPVVACYPSANDGLYYFNKSAWECQSCNARELAICPQKTSLRGGGCLGVNTPFNQTVPTADCSFCPINVPNLNVTKGKTYLNYRNSSAVGGCSIDACPALPLHYYWKQTCGADTIGEQKICAIDCPLNYYRYAECSADADLQCKSCTQNRAGYRKISNCSLFEDSTWQICDAGFFCQYSGNRIACPMGRTTVEGASDISNCFCKVGTRENAQGSECVPMQCPGTVLITNIPSTYLNSSYYMTLDMDTMSSTKCIRCSIDNTAYTRGDGLEITSCICPSGYYGIYNLLNTQIQCTQCQTSCSSNKLPENCANGDLKVQAGQSLGCSCAVPPFTTNTASCTSTCLSGFVANSNTRVIRSGSYPKISGSSTYTIKKDVLKPSVWNRFMVNSGYSSYDNTIRSLAVSGCMDDSVLGNDVTQVFHYEYIFWIITDKAVPVIFSALLQENAAELSGLSIAALPQWQIYTTDILLYIAASKWNIRQPYFSNGNNRDAWIYIAVLMRSTEDRGLFYMKSSAFNTTTNQNTGHWESNAIYNLTLFPPTFSGNAIPVSIAHSNKRLGESHLSGEGGFFYTTFNTWLINPKILNCGGLIVTSPIHEDASSIIVDYFCIGSNSYISSMSVTLKQDTLVPQVIISLSSGSVLKIEAFTDNGVSLLSPLAYDTLLTNMLVLFSLDNPVYLAMIHSDSKCGVMHDCIKSADSTQTSWVDIQGLPWGSSPTLMTVSVSTSSKAILIASSGTSIFTIPIYRCVSPTQYWDGVSCVEHTCIRQVSCSIHMVMTDGGLCICDNGYYQNIATCAACLSPNYCSGGAMQTCPSTTITSRALATSVSDCICISQGFSFNALLSPQKCVECRSIDSWCPNRWSKLSCPGNFIASSKLSDTLIAFPTKCSCEPGYTGATCALCPIGFYCPQSLTTFALNTAAYYTFTSPPLASLTLGYINSFFLAYFKLPGTIISNFATQQDLDAILYTQIVPATNRTLFGIMVMVQIDIITGVTTDNFKAWNTPLRDYLSTYDMMTTVSATSFDTVSVNRPLQCMISKVPASTPSTCICAPGYETQKEQCSPCAVNTFKAVAGPGLCTSCPIGTVSPMKASACIIDTGLLSTDASATTSSPDLMLMIGGIGGGVVGLILLIFIMQSVMKRSHT